MAVVLKRMALPEIVLIRPDRYADHRGHFSETFRKDWFDQNIGPTDFVQENQSLSVAAGTLRGLHFQTGPFAQGKLVRCIQGALFDVAVDIRHGSPGFGRWAGAMLSAENGSQLWIPEGFAHGFCTLVPDTVIAYKVTAYYSRPNDFGLAWDDPDIGINWPEIANLTTLSDKDRTQPRLAALPLHFSLESEESN